MRITLAARIAGGFVLAGSADAAAATVITNFSRLDSGVSLGWYGKSVRSYSVEETSDPRQAGAWTSLGGTNPAQDGPVCFPVAPTGAAAFYRVSYTIPDFPPGYWAHYDMPELPDTQRIALATQALADWDVHVADVTNRAQALSDALENHVKAWLAGETNAEVPSGLLPEYIDREKTKDWCLLRDVEIEPAQQWYVIPAHEIDPEYEDCYMLASEPYATYLKLLYVAPLGARITVEGEFPHCRFMDYEIIQPLDVYHPCTGQRPEQPEVPIVDADIEPEPGHVNPFRPGADRHATNRHYRVTFQLEKGNSVTWNPVVMNNPAHPYRDPSTDNHRVGGPFGFSGPFGSNVFTPGVLWLRYYLPDTNTGPLAGVPIPRATMQLKGDTNRFWLQPDLSLARSRQTTTAPIDTDSPFDPHPSFGPSVGWFKVFGAVLLRYESDRYLATWGQPTATVAETKAQIRNIFNLIQNRGCDATPPGNHESSATLCNYNHYLVRHFMLNTGRLYAITGKLPVAPRTRGGESPMAPGEVRYWSIAQYGNGEQDKWETSLCYDALMDEDVAVNSSNEFIIVYSYPDERPTNAVPAHGVTWQAWAPESPHAVVIRWLCVAPEWHLPAHAPDEVNIPWSNGAWSAEHYDSALVGSNRPGVMGPYHPVIHYITRAQFETLGTNVTPARLPEWE
ncbi:MAG: hypothetical protein KA248_01905 [Kiritimatiellae bacterium]|nr:hypothetical protein [Kiritimatiellia bacterium]